MSDDHDGVMPIGAAVALLAFAIYQFYSNHSLHNGLVSADGWHNAVDGLVPLVGLAVIYGTRRFDWHWTRHNLDPGTASLIYVIMLVLVVLTVRQPTRVDTLIQVVRIEGLSAGLNLAVAGWIWAHRRHHSRLSRALVLHLSVDVAVSIMAATAAYVAYRSHRLGLIGPVKLVLVVLVAGIAVHEVREVLPEIHRKATCKDPAT